VSGVTTHYLVDDLNPTGYAQVVEEVVSEAVEREYTYRLQRIDEIEGKWWTRLTSRTHKLNDPEFNDSRLLH